MRMMGGSLLLSKLRMLRSGGFLLLVSLTCLIISPSTRATAELEPRSDTGGMILESLRQLDEITAAATTTTTTSNISLKRKGNVDVVSQPEAGEDEEDGTIGICRLDYMVGFSRVVPIPPAKGGGFRRIPTNQASAVEGAAAVALAAHHLNTGNGSIVPQLEGLNETCRIRFAVDTIDSQWNQKLAVDQIIDLTTGVSNNNNNKRRRKPCAVLGSVFSRVTMSTAMITSMKGYVQTSYSTATELEDRDLFPLSTRILPSLSNNVAVLIRYLRHELGVKHLAVLHTDTRESQSYSVALQQAATLLAPDMTVQSFDIPDKISPPIIQQAVTKLKETQYTYFLAAVKVAHFDALWNETLVQGIAGTGQHTWFLPGGDGYFSKDVYERDSSSSPRVPWTTYPGINMVRLSGFWKHPVYDKLLEALQELGQSATDRDYILSKLPTYPDIIAQNKSNIFEKIVLKNPNFLQKEPKGGLITWAYDSAIANGLAACRAASAAETAKEDSTAAANYFDGTSHFNALTSMPTFHGSTGNITFDNTTGTRLNPRYRIVNIQEDPERSNATHIAFREVTTGMYLDDEFVYIADPIYNDGTTIVPPDLPPPAIMDDHSLSLSLQIVGWSMCGLVVVLAVAVNVWVLIHEEARVVRSAQPIFLHLLAIGVAIVGLAIIPLSVDKSGGGAGVDVAEDQGSADATTDEAATTMQDLDRKGCDIACRSFPWLVSIGFSLTFSALWAKTHRVNKLLQNHAFRRVTVSAMDVAKPMILVLCANVLVLSLWTALSPLHCETEIMVWDEFDRPIESRGYCTSSGGDAGGDIGYLIALAVINLGPLVFAVYEAYVARNISTEYAETDYILKALVVICLVCFIGIPVLVIAYDNPAAYFFVLSAILFVVGMSILILIFGPKLLAYYDVDFCSSKNSSLRNLPLRFSREGKSFRGSTSNASSLLALGSQASISELSGVSGLMILSHPKKQEELEEENNHLRMQNAEMKKSLMAVSPASNVADAVVASLNKENNPILARVKEEEQEAAEAVTEEFYSDSIGEEKPCSSNKDDPILAKEQEEEKQEAEEFYDDSINGEKPIYENDPKQNEKEISMQKTIEQLQDENEELRRKLMQFEKDEGIDRPECAP